MFASERCYNMDAVKATRVELKSKMDAKLSMLQFGESR